MLLSLHQRNLQRFRRFFNSPGSCSHACDRDACREDYWLMLGLCRECLTEEELAEARHREKPPPELDIKWVED